MADNVKILPKFDRLNFSILKVKMIIFIKSLESRVAKATTKSFIHLDSDEDSWSEITVKEFEANVKAHYALLQALNDDDIFRVINCTSTFNIWQNLITTHEGTAQMKKAKIDFS